MEHMYITYRILDHRVQENGTHVKDTGSQVQENGTLINEPGTRL